METPNSTTCDRTANCLEAHLALQWFTGEPAHLLQSRWVEVRSSLFSQALEVEQHQQMDNLLGKDSVSNPLALRWVQSDRSEA